LHALRNRRPRVEFAQEEGLAVGRWWQRLASSALPASESRWETRLARFASVIGLTAAAAALPCALRSAWIGRWPEAIVIAAMDVGVLLALWFGRRGRAGIAVGTLCAVFPLAIAALAMRDKALHDTAMLAFPATLVVGGLLLERRAFVALAAALTALVVSIGLLDPGGRAAATYNEISDAALIMLTTAMVVGLLAGSLRASLRQAERDIAERRQAEAEKARLEHALRHAQKMEAVGRLAGGIAHDFNNMLMIVGSSVTLAKRHLDPAASALQALTRAEGAMERAATLTRHLLTFSRSQVVEPRLLNLGELVEGLRPMLAGVLGEAVEIAVGAPPGLPPVSVDRALMEQALVNLAINARDAMPDGGKLSLDLHEVAVDAESARALGCRPGWHVQLTVSDTGCGMSEAVRQRAFEPFFTTKEPGRGTGLGLSTVYGAVKQHDGAIAVDSRECQGTTFRIYLPRA
jgi:signal transduction histidine kinase